MFPLGDYDTTETVHIPFNTFSSDDPSASVTITDLVAGDIEIHKDGAVAQRTSDNGVTVSINFDGVTGNHLVHIDLSDNSDAGFYAAGSRYQVRIEGATVDGATINAWIGIFSIGCTLRPAVDGRTLGVESDGDLTKVNTLDGHTAQTGDSFARIGATGSGLTSLAQAAVLGALANAAAVGEVTEADTLMQYIKQLINILIGTPGIGAFPAEAAPANAVSLAEVIRAIHADVTGLNGSAMIGTNSAALASVCTEARLAALTDWINGGRLDLLIDAIKAATDMINGSSISEPTDIATMDKNIANMQYALFKRFFFEHTITVATGALAVKNADDSEFSTQATIDNGTIQEVQKAT